MPEILSLNNQNTDSPPLSSSKIGETGEKLAAEFLVKNGYRLVLSNFKVPIGRNNRGVSVTGEIDIIACDENFLCFIEVKTRSSDNFVSPLAAVDLRKQRQIIRAAKIYRKIFHLSGVNFRYDVVTIILRDKEKPRIELFKNFWTESKFQKKSWGYEFW